MLAPSNPRHLDEPVAVSLEDLVPADNSYSHLESKRALGVVREWASKSCTDLGRPSIDPVVFFTLLLLAAGQNLKRLPALPREPAPLSIFY